MTMCWDVKTRCTACGHLQPIRIYSGAKMPDDSHLMDSILDGTINGVDCDDCGSFCLADVDFAYHDQERDLMIWFVPPYMADREDVGPVKRAPFEKVGRWTFAYRVVSTRASLAEKVRIFDAGLDDRVVEILKCEPDEVFRDHDRPHTHLSIFYESCRGSGMDMRVRFRAIDNVSLEERGSHTCEIGYEWVAVRYGKAMDRLSRRWPTAVIGRDFAEHVLHPERFEDGLVSRLKGLFRRDW